MPVARSLETSRRSVAERPSNRFGTAAACWALLTLASVQWLAGVLLAPPAHAAPAPADSTSPVEYLWVVRTSLLTHEDVVKAVARAKQLHVRGLLVQVVGRGDAYYTSNLLPRAEAIREADFDPLGTLLPLAHDAGLEVHAWMNCMLVWSDPHPPQDARHVLNVHPDWVARLKDGRRMTTLSMHERARLHVEGVFLAAGHPAVHTWLARIAAEIATHYPVDGIHLDYIRRPCAEAGWDPTTRARFALRTGIDPDRMDRLPPVERAAADSLWQEFQQEQVTEAVREVRDSLERERPDGIVLSAAVLADSNTARRRCAQSWGAWVRSGLLDRVYVMCYAPQVQTVMDQLLDYEARLGATERVVPGIAVYNTSPSIAAAKIKGARALGYPVLALYSYDALSKKPSYWAALRSLLEPRAPRD